MSIWRSLLGGVAGVAVLGGPLGLLIGAVAAHFAGKFMEGSDIAGKINDKTEQITFTVGVIALSAKMAKADGTVTRDEVEAFKKVFRVPEGEMKNVGRIFNQAKQDTAGYEAYAEQLGQLFRSQPAVLVQLLDVLFVIALADHIMHPAELKFLQNTASIFGFSKDEFASIKERHIGSDASDPYTIMGVDRGASDKEVKSAYRKLIKEHHPDKLIAQGVPKEFIDVATAKLAAINGAYDQIEKSRTMK